MIVFSYLDLAGWFYNLDAPDIAQGQERAKPILTAIYSYQREGGPYPATLEMLTPQYVATIPRASWRHSYCYDLRKDGVSFALAFVPQRETIGDGWDVYSSQLIHGYVLFPFLPNPVTSILTGR